MTAVSSLPGYSRLRCLNEFLPTDIQIHMMRHISRDNRVILSDFLIGDKAQNTPALPMSVAQEIKNSPLIHDKHRFSKQASRLANACNGIGLTDTPQIIDTLPNIIHLFRYVSTQTRPFESALTRATFLRTATRLLNELNNIKNKGFPKSNPELDRLLDRVPAQWTPQQLALIHILYKRARYELTNVIQHLNALV